MTRVKISTKNQIVIPKAVRKALGVGAGDEMEIVERGGRIELLPRPKSYTKATLGLGKSIWSGVDAVQYVKQERASWQKTQS